MDAQQLKIFLVRYGLKPNFTYGQNFLVDDSVLMDIVNAAEIAPTDKILEIGPGVGNLTRLLCQRAGFVLSIEKDPKFFPILKAIKKDHKNFRYEIADALGFDFLKTLISTRIDNADLHADPRVYPRNESASRSAAYKVVANIPYYITGKILSMLLSAKTKPSLVVILTQKEVAESLSAKAGDMSVLAISVQLYGEPKIFRIVPAESFYPAPKVDSAIVRINIYREPKYQLADEKSFFRIVKACFAGKRKQIHNTLVNNLQLDKTRVLGILSELKINPAARPQELEIEEWIELTSKSIINSKLQISNCKSRPKS